MVFPFTWTYSKCRKTDNSNANDQTFPRIDEDPGIDNASQRAIQESVEQYVFELQLQEIVRIYGETSESMSITSDIQTTNHISPYQENEAFSLSIMSDYETSEWETSSIITSSSRNSEISGISIVIDEIQRPRMNLNRNRLTTSEVSTHSRTSSESSSPNQENTSSEAGLC